MYICTCILQEKVCQMSLISLVLENSSHFIIRKATKFHGGCSLAGKASVCGTEDRGFKSRQPPHLSSWQAEIRFCFFVVGKRFIYILTYILKTNRYEVKYHYHFNYQKTEPFWRQTKKQSPLYPHHLTIVRLNRVIWWLRNYLFFRVNFTSNQY